MLHGQSTAARDTLLANSRCMPPTLTKDVITLASEEINLLFVVGETARFYRYFFQ